MFDGQFYPFQPIQFMDGLLAPPIGFTGSLTFQQIIESAVGTSNLDFVLDAGDSASYDGSSQTWVDTHGANDFFRGATSGAEASDPTFNGSAGGLTSSEYFSFDNGDYFTEASALTFAETWHKDNAAFSIVAVYWPIAGTTDQTIFTTAVVSGGRGVRFRIESSEALELQVVDGAAVDLTITTAGAVSAGAWNFVAVALDEATGANGATLQIGSTQSSHTSTYTTPSASDSNGPYQIGAANGANNSLDSGSRLACIAGWSRRLSTTELSDLRTALQARFTGI